MLYLDNYHGYNQFSDFCDHITDKPATIFKGTRYYSTITVFRVDHERKTLVYW